MEKTGSEIKSCRIVLKKEIISGTCACEGETSEFILNAYLNVYIYTITIHTPQLSNKNEQKCNV